MQNKNKLGLILIISLLGMPCLVQAAGGIHIVVKSEITDRNPVVNIWLNDEFKGAIEGRAGIYFDRLKADIYNVKAVTKGFEPFYTDVRVSDDQVVKIRISFIFPKMKIEDVVSIEQIAMVKQVGTVIFKSVPLHAIIYLDGKRIGAADKKIENIFVGSHSIGFSFKNTSVGSVFELKPNETLIVTGLLKENRITKEVSVAGTEEDYDFGRGKKDEEFSIAGTHWEGSECNTYGDCWKLKVSFNADGFIKVSGGMTNKVEWVQNVNIVELFTSRDGEKIKMGEFKIKTGKTTQMEGWETMSSHTAKLTLITQEM